MRKKMVECGHPQLSLRRQCKLLTVNRNRLRATAPEPATETDRVLRLMDEVHLTDPSYGSRRLRAVLKRDHGVKIGRDQVRTLMKLAHIRPCYPKPRTSQPGNGHKIYPYLLRDMAVDRPDQVWCSDITYIPMARGFCYLAAIMDWHSRAVLGWTVSTTMDASLCLEAFRSARQATGKTPSIMNTDQGSQYTGQEWIQAMKSAKIRISMDGKGRWVDNVFIERLWRSVKYEDIYLRSYANLRELTVGLQSWFERYNGYRPHSSLNKQTPWIIYRQEAA
jgi:putative transposase